MTLYALPTARTDHPPAPAAGGEPLHVLRLLLDNLRDVVFQTDHTARWSYLSPAWAELTGFRADECLGMPLPDALHPDDRSHCTARLAALLQGEREAVRGDVRLRDRDGGYRWVELHAQRVPASAPGGAPGLVGTLHDISEHRAVEAALQQAHASLEARVAERTAELRRSNDSLGREIAVRQQAVAALQASEARFRTLVESAADAVLLLNERGVILSWNRGAEQIFGYTAAEAIGQTLALLMSPAAWEKHRAALARPGGAVGHGSGSRRVTMHGTHRDGRPVPLEMCVASWATDGERFYSAILRDITERLEAEERLRQSEQQLRQAQKMEAVGRLAGGIAHDFNNVLMAIDGHTDLLLHTGALEEKVRWSVEQIRRASERGAALTRQLLTFSRKQAHQPRPLDLNGVVQDIAPMLRRLIGETIALETSLAPDLGRVHADRSQMDQVLMNLAVNARDAMPDGGCLALATERVELPAADDPAALPAGSYVRLAVSDTGLGMDADTASHVFEPFFTTKPKGKGTGLGLSTVYGIVKQSGGQVRVWSEVGRGSTFELFFPCVEVAHLPLPDGTPPPPAPAAAGPAAPPLERGQGEEILVVEDEAPVRGLLRRLLAAQGYRVLEAADGAQALQVARAAERVDLLLTDAVMPGMSGRELAQRLAAERGNLAVLYISGYTEDAVQLQGVTAPGAAFLQKPFTARTLQQAVRAALAARAAPAAPAPYPTDEVADD